MCPQDSCVVSETSLVKVVIADDDESAVDLMREAFERTAIDCDLDSVSSGQQLLDYLRKQEDLALRPSLIFLDLNMPGKDGRQTLQEIKSDPKLRDIPVIIMTSSELEEDVDRSYASGVNAYLKKPSLFADLLQMTRAIKEFWFGCASLPQKSNN